MCRNATELSWDKALWFHDHSAHKHDQSGANRACMDKAMDKITAKYLLVETC